MPQAHTDSPAVLEGAVKKIISDLEKHLKVQQEKLRVLYKEWNFWEAAGALLDFNQLEVSDLKIGEIQKQLIEAQIEQLKLENDLTHMTEFARQVFSQTALGFKTPSFPIPIPSANLFPFSAKYSHPTPPPKSYGQQMNQRRQDDFRYYLEHPEMLATMPGPVSSQVPNLNNSPALAPKLTLQHPQMPLTPPLTPPSPHSVHPPAQTSTSSIVEVSPITVPKAGTTQIPTQSDLFFIRRMTAYRESVYGSQKGIHPTDGKRNYRLDPHFWEKKENWDGTEDFWSKPSARKRGRMEDEDEALSPCSIPRKRVRAAGGM
ncbi:hypothetical protein QBC32DRAFT_384649 [Pseudoneurospora amorphoporcata]|uniref:Uncharacterized protein n=1 Tax=Pseudoneurospora amorphoporcata TaxID=241081 RepID=A0AAN6SBB0_9PEZI|nr:hypothetical protein QBC32DRAFT_384649 [Pseudoneurospora amorphoporcata]